MRLINANSIYPNVHGFSTSRMAQSSQCTVKVRRDLQGGFIDGDGERDTWISSNVGKSFENWFGMEQHDGKGAGDWVVPVAG
jgi:hypothetical protein